MQDTALEGYLMHWRGTALDGVHVYLMIIRENIAYSFIKIYSVGIVRIALQR